MRTSLSVAKMNSVRPLLFRTSSSFRSSRTATGHQPISDERTDEITCVRFWTILGSLLLLIGIIMVAYSYISHHNYDMEVALAFIVCSGLVFAIVLGYICHFWWKVQTRRKEAPDDEETGNVGDYIRDIFCLPPRFRGERTEPEGERPEELLTEIMTSC